MADRPTLPEPGDIVAGKYRIEHTLGTGGMGVVFQVSHHVTGKRFALKWLLPEASTHTDAAKRFIREAQVAGRFEHPNVVEVYDVGSDGDSFYMVMELLEGESLATRVERLGALPVADACALLIPCMRGVAEAHAAGIIHRDIKPANIFVRRATKETPECAKVLDFGISKVSVLPGELDNAMTRTGVLMGTPYYMPLEQMRGRDIDERVDVYAFGVVLYQVLSGKLPYQADSFSDLVLLIANEVPPELEQVVPGLPTGLGEVVRKAMARDPEHRYTSMGELIAALLPYDEAGAATRGSGSSTNPAPVRPVHIDNSPQPPTGSAAHPTPLSTESNPDLPAYSPPLARARAGLIAGAAALVTLGAGAFLIRQNSSEPATPTPKGSAAPEVTLVRPAEPAAPQRTAAAAGGPDTPAPTPGTPAELTAPVQAPVTTSAPPQRKAKDEIRERNRLGVSSEPNARERASGVPATPSERQRTATATKSGSASSQSKTQSDRTAAAVTPAATDDRSAKRRLPESPKTPHKADFDHDVPAKPQPPITPPKPTSRLPQISERDFY